jgi:pimeloyl-ACP methyl ester carboxylesterase
VHGYCLDSRCWHFQWRALADRARLVAYDQRSHGRSGRSPTMIGIIDALGEDLLAVLDRLAPTGPVALVGHSMGGMTVMALADAHPELFGDRVRGAALLSTSAGALSMATFGLPAGVAALAKRVVPLAVPVLRRRAALVDRTRAAAAGDLVNVLTRWFSYRSRVDPRLVEFLAEMIGGTPFEVMADFYPAFADHDKLAALGVLRKVETLVVVGDGDLLTPPSHSEDIAREVPTAQLVVVPEAGHVVQLEHADLVDELLADWLDRVEPRQ